MSEPDLCLPVLCIMGPTACGKTKLALDIAKRLPCEIVSVDSALVYRGLNVGTAKPNPAQRRQAIHHLIDIREPAESYSAAQFRDDAIAAIGAIHARRKLPLLVGGTGLYFRALERGIALLPGADSTVRATLRAELERIGSAALHARLQAVDPASAARIHPNDPQRLIRALEVHALTGSAMSELWATPALAAFKGRLIKVAIAPANRADLGERIAIRFVAMMARGFLNEMRALRSRPELSAALPAMRTVGYREAWRYLDGDISRTEMIERAITATRQLAKRQLTWLRGDSGWHWLNSDAHDLTAQVLARLPDAKDIFQASQYGLQ